jgi:hypothetical protein
MDIDGRLSDEELVMVIADGEWQSPRWRERLWDLGVRRGHEPSLLLDHDSPLGAVARWEVWRDLRDYDRREYLFEGFPRDTTWYSAIATERDLRKCSYLNDPRGWLAATGGTRSPSEAAARALTGAIRDTTLLATLHDVQSALNQHRSPRPLVLVCTPSADPVVVLEGNARITAYLMEPALLPAQLPMILGCSEHIDQWVFW